MADEKLVEEETEEFPRSVQFTFEDDLKQERQYLFSLTKSKIPAKFQSAYKEITGCNVNWKDIPLNLRNSLLTSEPLSGQEFIELPRNFGIAYLAFRKPSDDVILDKIEKRIVSYEEKYGMSSSDFYNKYHDSEAIFDGSQEQTLDFLMWLSIYEEYSELGNVSR